MALDLEGDGDSDLLLVAAPTYLEGQSRETGRVYVYRVGQVRGQACAWACQAGG